MKNDPEILDEVANLLSVILPSWQALAKTSSATAPATPVEASPRLSAS